MTNKIKQLKWKYPFENIYDLLTTQAQRAPDKIALLAPQHQPLSYEKLLWQVSLIANNLNTLGIRKNDRVAIALPNGPEMAVTFLGVSTSAVCVPINIGYRDHECEKLFSDLKIKALISHESNESAAFHIAKKHRLPMITIKSHADSPAGLFTTNIATAEKTQTKHVIHKDDVALLLTTSGTTSRPKQVPLTQLNLCSSAHHCAVALQLSDRDICLNLMPLFHIHGLIGGLLAPLSVGGTVICPPDFIAPRFLDWLMTFKPTWYTAVPTMHQSILTRIAQNKSKIKNHSLRFIRSSSAPLPPQVMEALTAAFKIPVIEAYGMTEATHQIASNPLPPGKQKPYSVGIAAGPQVGVVNPQGIFLGTGETGEVVIKGANVIKGYVANEKANKDTFIKDWLRTGDIGYIDADGYLFLTDRIKEIINRAGENISPREIDDVLLQHPAISQAVTFAVPDQTLGEDVAAAIVLKEGREVSEQELQTHVAEQLANYKVPRQIVFLTALPKGPTGKLQRIGLAEKLGIGAISVQSDSDKPKKTSPNVTVEKTLIKIWQEVLGIKTIRTHDDFMGLGGDSILASMILVRIKTHFSVELPFVLFFKGCTITLLAEQILEQKNKKTTRESSITKLQHRNNRVRLSFAQECLWFLDQLEPHHYVYNMPMVLNLKGRLNLAALETSLNTIVKRHETLRTVFKQSQGVPYQVVQTFIPQKINTIDFGNIPKSKRYAKVQTLVDAESKKCFDLSKGPLIRFSLIEIQRADYLLLITMHHIISDGWSRNILMRELGLLYNAVQEGQKAHLAKLRIQYRDFSIWQRQWLTGKRYQQQLDFWKKYLKHAPRILNLPTDHPRPNVQSYRGACINFTISEVITQKLIQLGHVQNATLFMVISAVFNILLYRYTQEEDIVIGSPTANRNHTEIENLIGFFVNSLAMRTDLSGNPTFSALLKYIRTHALAAYTNQDLPFEQVVEALQPERTMSHHPIFQVMLVVQNTPSNKVQLNGVEQTDFYRDCNIAKFDLTLELVQHNNQLSCSLQYATDLFEKNTIARMAQHFQNLLTGVIENSQLGIAQLELMSIQERKQLLVDWNKTAKPYPKNKCIHELFEEQAKKTPNNTALLFRDQKLSYKDLNSKANQLAHYLQKLGVEPETMVAICVERSLEMVIGILGILKAGGAYVPIDTNYPKTRLQYILKDTKAQIMLTQHGLVYNLDYIGKLVYLDRDSQEIGKYPRNNIVVEVSPNNLAYVIYTSGSTGRPKGVVVMHKNTASLIYWAHKNYDLDRFNAVLACTSICFDLSVYELFVPITMGGTVVLVKDILNLCNVRSTFTLSLINTVPSAIRQLLGEGLILKSVKAINLAGETLSESLVTELYQKTSVSDIYNLYGPTEATTYATLSRCLPGKTVTIGKPISNTHVYILDCNLNPVPIGVSGELHIGGSGLVKGYLNRPELTQAKFIANPFSHDSKARLYKTGDLARYLPDGDIEFLGRIDNQVKIRGFRIELGEIEANLVKHKLIKEAVVIVRAKDGDKYLVAYVIANTKTIEINKLRDFLKTTLPDYMIPNIFVQLEKLPLTANGKIDRKALPEPDESDLTQERYIAPSNPTEELIAGVWSGILQVKKIGINDNFFELGGHSLLATQVVSRLREALNIDVPLKSLFESPTVSAMAQTIRRLSTEGIALDQPPIKPISRQQSLPLSFAQERLWFIDQLEPDSGAYNIPIALRLEGVINVKALSSALNAIRKRHESLRTVFKSKTGKPKQVVQPHEDMTLSIVDLSQEKTKAESSARELAKAEAIQPFNLSEGPLLRTQLLKLNKQTHVLLITMHHIISDGWSMGIFQRELNTFYAAYSQDKTPSIPQLPIQYADFSYWQRQWLAGMRYDAQLKFWQASLQDAPSLLNLPTDRPRPRIQSHRGANKTFSLSKATTQALHKLGQAQGATLFMTMLAAFNVLLYRYTQEEHIVIGSPIANRNHKEIEGLIGFFVNTLALHTDLSGNPSFVDLLKRVRKLSLDAYAHQDLPFEHLVEALQPERCMSHHPLFQVMMVLQNNPTTQVKLGTAKQSHFATDFNVAKFDLTLHLLEHNDQLVGHLQYATDLFDDDTITRMVGHFNHLIAAILKDPKEKIAQLPLLDEKEHKQILVDWNAKECDYPKDKCIHQLFEEQVLKTPNNIALVFENQQLTYKELNSKANQLGHYLQNLGVKQESLVAICVQRSVEMVVGILGILKAGGAYVPLDPSYPKARLQFILKDSDAPILLTQQGLQQELDYQGRIIFLDDWAKIAQYPNKAPITNVIPENLAYVIYTSGTTGRPKGVLQLHHNIVRLFRATEEFYQFTQKDVWSLFHSFVFDFSIWELWGGLIYGGKVVIPSRHEVEDLSLFYELCKHHQVTILNQTPQVFYQFIKQVVDKGKLSSLRYIIFGGEQLNTERIVPWFDAFGDQSPKLINMYGITEITVHATINEVHKQALPYQSNIGRPINDLQIYILDKFLNLLPVGVPGEIYVSGAGLARGYLNQEKLTKERFIANPFSTASSSKLYKTGDLARFLPDGSIEFLGRIDTQVKIRGFRIELGEIEATLTTHELIKEAIVVAERHGDDKRLIAYFIANTKQVAVNDLRNFLKTKLPDYMLPSIFIQMTHFPLTSNGKIDHKILPLPDESSFATQKYQPPTNKTEKLIADIWSDVLKVQKIGIYDNFFELGGHSLLATQIIARLRQALKVDVPLRSIFENPTLESLSQAISTLSVKDTMPIKPVLRSGEMSLSFAQERLWFLNRLEPNNTAYNMPFALRLEGVISLSALERTLNSIKKRHESLRTVFKETAGEPQQVIKPHSNVKLELVDVAQFGAKRISEAQKIVKAEAQRPFDLSQGPLFRFKIVKLDDEVHILLITLHHIIADGWSVTILWREIETLYQAYIEKRHPSLDPLPIQYADFAIWQRQRLTSILLDTQLDYWKKQLSDANMVLELPTDYIRPAIQTYHGGREFNMLSNQLTIKLRQLCKKTNTTLFMTLLAVFNVLLYRHTGQDDILIGTPILGRTSTESERLIGLFLNSLALRIRLADKMCFDDLLLQQRGVCLEAYANQDIPIEKLIVELKPERDLSRSSLFQVFFNMVPPDTKLPELPGINVTHFDRLNVESKFDLTLYVTESKDEIGLSLVYNTGLFRPDRMGEFLGQYQLLLSQIVENPCKKIIDYTLITSNAKRVLPCPTQTLDAEWVGSVQELFSLQAKANPDQIAIVDNDRQWRYQDLDRYSNQLANCLITKKIAKGDIVVIFAQRHATLILAILGVLKAGAAFLILDPAYPSARLISYLDAARPTGLLQIESAGILSGELTAYFAQTSLKIQLVLPNNFQQHPDVLKKFSQKNPNIVVDQNSLAYVAFTSGSTGKPKGVIGQHGPLSHFIPWQRKTFEFNTSDKYSMLSGLSHDPLQRDIFTPLCTGGTICIPDQEKMADPDWLNHWIKQSAITVVHLTPAMGQLITQIRAPKKSSQFKITSLRYAFFVGDILTRQDVLKLHQIAPALTCVNYFGSTETQRSVGYTVINFDQIKLAAKETIPLGRGIKDVQVLILNQSGKLAGIGECGEIAIRSPHLAGGYLGNDLLTRKRFITNPYVNDRDDRIYMTGDAGRYQVDGTIDVIGRLDRQVKIRGFRVELEEIEANLLRHNAIKEAIVLLQEDKLGNKRLVAYIVFYDKPISTSILRSSLKKVLPEYMLPNFFMVLKKIPLTPNGKINRNALPRPEEDDLALTSQFIAPKTPVEMLIANVWSEVLNLKQIGVNDNFFELGGHSLIATQVASRLKEAINVDIPLKMLFANPDISTLARKLTAIAKNSDQFECLAIKPIPRTQILPLSYAEERLWFLDQLTPNSVAYNIPVALRFEGDIKIVALSDALNSIRKRHESLRTVFKSDAGKPRQVVQPHREVTLSIVDLSQEKDKAESKARELAKTEATKPFKLSEGPLLRVQLLKLDNEMHILLITMHHIISDGWSMGIFIRELSTFYEAYSQGMTPAIAQLPIQYADFSYWQRQWLAGKRYDTQLNFWQNALKKAPSLINLPTDRPRPHEQSHRGANKTFTLSKSTTRALHKLSQAQGATLFMTLLTLFNVLLYRYIQEENIVVGSPIANRNHKEIEGLIGFFVNTLALHTDLSGNPSFIKLLERVRKISLDAYAHQDLPFEHLVEALQPQRSMSHHPIFQVMLILQNNPIVEMKFRDVKLSQFRSDLCIAKFDLLLNFVERNNTLSGSLEYATSLFDESTIIRMIGHLNNLVEAVIENPHEKIANLAFLSRTEKQQLLIDWNKTESRYPTNKCIQQLFEEQVQKSPEGVALICGDQQLTYQELNCKSNQLAHYLVAQGVKPETLVAICVKRSFEMVIGVLGILKAGGAYVPLEPHYPNPRLQFILDDIKAPILLTQQGLINNLNYASKLVMLDQDWEVIAQNSNENCVTQVTPENLAYVLYTSGSTGKPKGVMITHRSLCNFRYAIDQASQFHKQQCLLSITTLSFDISIMELLVPITFGTKCVILSDENSRDPYEINAALKKYNVTGMQATPSTWNMLLATGWKGSKNFDIYCGGEALQMDLAQRLVECCNQLWNLYGPTEATIWSTILKVGETYSKVMIGRPLANTTCYILDAKLNPVPIGVPGELYIGGLGLAKGYLNLGDLTSEMFISDPFSHDPNARLYKSGDQARYLADGNIEFLGRIDNQVKIRGFRIELGEIEAALLQHESIEEAAVLVKGNKLGNNYLVAHIALNNEAKIDRDKLRLFLREKLPAYMIPHSFVCLAQLPLNQNGKVDHQALLNMQTQELKTGRHYSEPQTPIQVAIAEVWKKLLKLDKISIHDNFFDLGGHSLLSIEAIAKIEQDINIRIPPRDFIFSTLGQIAANFEQSSTVSTIERPIIQPVYFGDESAKLYGCYHLQENVANTDCGFILCYPFGQEYICAHRTYKVLANKLSQLGYPTLRFEYYGVGDSMGTFEEATLDRWSADISLAIEALQRKAGVDKICLVGLRLGGDLCIMNTVNTDLTNYLILWDPIISGRGYVDQMLLLQADITRKQHSKLTHLRQKHLDHTESSGYPLSNQLLSQLQTLTLPKPNKLLTENILCLAHEEHQLGQDFNALLTGMSQCLTIEHYNGPIVWQEDPSRLLVPHQQVETILKWIVQNVHS